MKQYKLTFCHDSARIDQIKIIDKICNSRQKLKTNLSPI